MTKRFTARSTAGALKFTIGPPQRGCTAWPHDIWRLSQKSRRTLLLFGIVEYLIDIEPSHLRWGGKLKVKVALPHEYSPREGLFFTIQIGARSCRIRKTK